ncbi:MAG: hypothetical protein NVS4B3_11710 [Gemmatimonadaceae bacterium]
MRNVVSILLSLLVATPTLAQPPAALKAASEARTGGMRAGHGKEWAKYTTDDFLVTGPTGVVSTKAQRLSEVDGHAQTGSPTASTDDKWRLYGTTAIHTFQQGGEKGANRLTEVWVKQGRLWKVAAVQVTPVVAATSP